MILIHSRYPYPILRPFPPSATSALLANPLLLFLCPPQPAGITQRLGPTWPLTPFRTVECPAVRTHILVGRFQFLGELLVSAQAAASAVSHGAGTAETVAAVVSGHGDAGIAADEVRGGVAG